MMLQRRKLLVATACVSVLGATGVAFANRAAKGDPFVYIVDLSNQVLDRIRKNAALHSAEPERVEKLVDQYMMPASDFTLMTRLVVGPHWRKATQEQRRALQQHFRALLVRIYSGSLTTIKDHRCVLRPTRNKKIQDEMIVRTLLKSNGNPDIALDYRIYRNKEGFWKVVDVNVEGIWMVENYRSQFSSILNQQGVDGLIQAMKEKTEATKRNL